MRWQWHRATPDAGRMKHDLVVPPSMSASSQQGEERRTVSLSNLTARDHEISNLPKTSYEVVDSPSASNSIATDAGFLLKRNHTQSPSGLQKINVAILCSLMLTVSQ
ncbi:hypothetical protein M404DRAFT_999350 [Pisolithus tinctorius Marx 270]|uniref:Uncharacterized protein n=1 Tax=Pisolithus tinctorius Marx 270 TaxID=870435 RepID=A0A0C3PDB9_PISTI|nr:hypothetical protein M404DRAFT_999350 [Pisolithus tinctorius Marx 270]